MKPLEEMLAGIPWHRLEAAHGTVPGVPDLVRRLASSDPRAREEALYDLLETVTEQGTVYEPCAYLVAPLVHLLRTPGFPGRREALELLFQFARGNGHFTVHQRLSIVREMYGPEKIALEVAKETQWLAKLHAGLLEGAGTFLTCLNDPSPEIRKRALAILGRLPERTSASLPRIRAMAASDPDEETRQTAQAWVQELEKK